MNSLSLVIGFFLGVSSVLFLLFISQKVNPIRRLIQNTQNPQIDTTGSVTILDDNHDNRIEKSLNEPNY